MCCTGWTRRQPPRLLHAITAGTALVALLIVPHAAADEDLAVLPGTELPPGDQMLREYLRVRVHRALDVRKQTFEDLDTTAQIAAYQRRLRSLFVEHLGGFPERTPLNPRVVGVIERDDYRVEKLIFETRPGFFVTGVLYLPSSPPPYPGVLHPCGHSENGKQAEAYQRASILMARNGIAVLCYDPIGQGERKQLLDENGGGRYRSTTEHMIDGVAPILLGRSLATYMIWDGMRGLDYLASREDVDASRLGCTGNSGGGNMTSYLMVLDDRILSAAPGCFITTTGMKNESPGPGDAEQNIHGQIAYGLDHADYLLLRAPRPTLILAATHDFVPIEGTWQSFRQAKRLFGKLGFPEHVDLIEADERHGFTSPLRVGATRWMRRWLLEEQDPIDENGFPIFEPRDLQCTPEGQVQRMPGARSIFERNRQTARKLFDRRRGLQRTLDDRALRERVRELAGIQPLAELPEPRVAETGTLKRGELTINKLVFHVDDHLVLPALLFSPTEVTADAVLYLHGEGKQADAAVEGPIERLAAEGHCVLAVDLRGIGETRVPPWRYGAAAGVLGDNSAEFFIAYMLGRSLVGMRAEDALVSARYLSQLDGELRPVRLLAVGEAGVPALHAAAAVPELFNQVIVRDSLASWESVVEIPVTRRQLNNVIHGALATYDLPDLVRLIGVDRVTLESPRDAAGAPL